MSARGTTIFYPERFKSHFPFYFSSFLIGAILCVFFIGGKIIDILGVLDDIATADDAMHDVAESIENLLKNLGFIEE